MTADGLNLLLMGTVASWTLVSVRFLGLFLALPMLGFRAYPLALRMAPVLALTWLVAPQVALTPAQVAQVGMLMVGSELAIGLVAGLALRLAMLAVDYTAEVLAMLAGFSFGQTVAPDSALPSTVLGELLAMSVLAVLFAADVHLLFIERIAQSFASVPLGSWPTGWSASALLALVSGALQVGLVMSCASFGIYLFNNFMLGLINRISPQLNLMSVGFSISAPLALVVLALLVFQLPAIAELIAQQALAFVDLGLAGAR